MTASLRMAFALQRAEIALAKSRYASDPHDRRWRDLRTVKTPFTPREIAWFRSPVSA